MYFTIVCFIYGPAKPQNAYYCFPKGCFEGTIMTIMGEFTQVYDQKLETECKYF